jgi:hypothetical protein
VGKSEGKRPLEDIGVNGRITLKCMLKKGCEDGDWMKLDQNRDKLRAVVRTLMNFCVPYSEGVGWRGKELLVSQAVSPSATQCHCAAQHRAHQHVWFWSYNQTYQYTPLG